MKNIYFDNAATTSVEPLVVETMTEVLKDVFGNPSSIHLFGRQAKVVVENARKKIANLINVTPSEIFFTSGGTEAINTAINGCVKDLKIENVITAEIEHPAVLNSLKKFSTQIKLNFVKFDNKGNVDFHSLEELLKINKNALVVLMHANNEIGNLLSIKETGEICEKYNALFFSDTVQTTGKYKIDFSNLNLHFAVCSAHKFHGPKGAGFLYVKNGIKINPLIFGGNQEMNMRAGTENIAGIAGMAKALEIASDGNEKNMLHIKSLKEYLIQQLKINFKNIIFNGDCEERGLYNLVNFSFPKTEKTEVLIYNLDIAGIAVSGGSACASGANKPSRVLKALNCDIERTAIRVSFSKYNTKDEIDLFVEKLIKLINA
ncbi:MAG: cysteine desulfurase family protein [Bacteroidales bacterium]|nr:cysteine desulfurase family protein [Bacteroidales bacterium]